MSPSILLRSFRVLGDSSGIPGLSGDLRLRDQSEQVVFSVDPLTGNVESDGTLTLEGDALFMQVRDTTPGGVTLSHSIALTPPGSSCSMSRSGTPRTTTSASTGRCTSFR